MVYAEDRERIFVTGIDPINDDIRQSVYDELARSRQCAFVSDMRERSEKSDRFPNPMPDTQSCIRIAFADALGDFIEMP